MKNSILIAQESSWYLRLKIYTLYEKRIYLFSFCVYEKFSQKQIFLYININNNNSHQKEATCIFIYIYISKHCETFIYIYKKHDTLQKSKQFQLRFYLQKSRHFPLCNFLWNFWNWLIHIYKKYHTLHYVTFLYTKSLTLRK